MDQRLNSAIVRLESANVLKELAATNATNAIEAIWDRLLIAHPVGSASTIGTLFYHL